MEKCLEIESSELLALVKEIDNFLATIMPLILVLVGAWSQILFARRSAKRKEKKQLIADLIDSKYRHRVESSPFPSIDAANAGRARPQWSNILVKILSNPACSGFVQFLGVENIKVMYEKKSSQFSTLIREERFGTVMITKVSLVDGGGNYKGQRLSTYQSAVSNHNRELRIAYTDELLTTI